MNYYEALEYVETQLKGGCNPGLGRINRLLELIGNPQKSIKAIHIGGTNGKGSTAAMISSVIREAGYKVGIYTSPHLISIRERYIIDNKTIGELEFANYTKLLKKRIDIIKKNGEEIPSQFEMLTAMAFLYMKDENVDLAVIEVGLGGRFDATNVLNSIITIITSIGYDHTDILGDTIKRISFEKAGILKENGITVLYPQTYSEARDVIMDVSSTINNKIIEVKKEDISLVRFSFDCQTFNYDNNKLSISNIKLPLLGEHQLINAAVAIEASLLLKSFGYEINERIIKKGIEKVEWMGRLSIISKEPLIIIDGAHNLDGMKALSLTIKNYFKEKNLILVMGMLRDKEYRVSLKILASMAEIFIATEPVSDRKLNAKELGEEAKKYCNNVKIEPAIKDAVKLAIESYTKQSIICVCGSLYLIGEVYNLFN